MKKELSPREEEILDLCVDGLTNEAIAIRLGLSVGTVKTYWLRIRSKFGGASRMETVAQLIQERANTRIEVALAEKADIEGLRTRRYQDTLQLRSAMVMLDLVAQQTQSTLWAADTDLQVQILSQGNALGKSPLRSGGTVQEMFCAASSRHPAIDAHLQALAGQECSRNLTGSFSRFHLQVVPLRRADDDASVIGCIGVLHQESLTLPQRLSPLQPAAFAHQGN